MNLNVCKLTIFLFLMMKSLCAMEKNIWTYTSAPGYEFPFTEVYEMYHNISGKRVVLYGGHYKRGLNHAVCGDYFKKILQDQTCKAPMTFIIGGDYEHQIITHGHDSFKKKQIFESESMTIFSRFMNILKNQKHDHVIQSVETRFDLIMFLDLYAKMYELSRSNNQWLIFLNFLKKEEKKLSLTFFQVFSKMVKSIQELEVNFRTEAQKEVYKNLLIPIKKDISFVMRQLSIHNFDSNTSFVTLLESPSMRNFFPTLSTLFVEVLHLHIVSHIYADLEDQNFTTVVIMPDAVDIKKILLQTDFYINKQQQGFLNCSVLDWMIEKKKLIFDNQKIKKTCYCCITRGGHVINCSSCVKKIHQKNK